MLQRRDRLVSFRLSDDEYHDLRNYCLERGARSISDCARAVIFELSHNQAPQNESSDPAITDTAKPLIVSVERLTEHISKLIQLMEESNGRTEPERLAAPEEA